MAQRRSTSSASLTNNGPATGLTWTWRLTSAPSFPLMYWTLQTAWSEQRTHLNLALARSSRVTTTTIGQHRECRLDLGTLWSRVALPTRPLTYPTPVPPTLRSVRDTLGKGRAHTTFQYTILSDDTTRHWIRYTYCCIVNGDLAMIRTTSTVYKAAQRWQPLRLYNTRHTSQLGNQRPDIFSLT